MPASKRTTAASAAPTPRRTSTLTAPGGAVAAVGGGASTRSQWTKTFSNGDSYHGEALHVHDADQKPIKDGKGRYTWASSGAIYEGEWKSGKPHGQGVMSVPGKDGYEYTGGFVEGQRSGQGKCRFANGRIYEGEWKADEMNGQGTVHGAPGADDYETYTGSFELGQRSGPQGRCVYVNGDVYDGAWLAGQRQGMGEWLLHRAASSVAVAPVRYTGPFDHDAPRAGVSAEASIEYSDGSSYSGSVNAQLRRHGQGVHRLSNGDVFDGAFVQDQREGRGVLQEREGTVCEGTWRRGQLEGQVRVAFAAVAAVGAGRAPVSDLAELQQLRRSPYPLQSYEGPCSAGVLTGAPATIVYTDGSTYRGAVRNGLPHGAGVLRDRPLPYPSTGAATSAAGEEESLRRRISVACLPASVSLTLECYEGGFAAGEPDGTGTGEWQVSQHASSSSSAVVLRATPSTFADVLARGVAWWPAASYAAVDGSYAGQWVRGLPQGQGKWQWVNGASYTGGLACFLPSGHGTYASAALMYTGDFVGGLPEGQGVLEDKASDLSYDGMWVHGKPCGEGVCTVMADYTSSTSGAAAAAASVGLASTPPRTNTTTSTALALPCTTVYAGTWEDGKPSGHGRTYATPDRQRVVYDGHYAGGRCEGEGTLYFGSVRRGSVNSEAVAAAVHAYAQYSGAFTHGHPGGGSGCLTLRNNTTVESVFDADLHPCPGATVTVRPHNEAWTFKGTFDAALRVGRGTMTFPNGDVYRGEVEDAAAADDDDGTPSTPAHAPLLYNLQRHGEGIFTFVEGNQLQCTWRHNVLHGAGVYTSSDGVKTERTYADGVLANDNMMVSVGASSGGMGSVGAGASLGNVFTPENEFPNTLSADALKSRQPDQPPQRQPTQQQQQQQRKRAPFNFVRRGEARQASTAGAAPSPSPRTATTPSTAGDGGNAREANGSKGARRSPPATSLATATGVAVSPKKGSGVRQGGSPPTSVSRTGKEDASAAAAAAARTPTRATTAAAAAASGAPGLSTPSAAAAGATTAHKYSLRRYTGGQGNTNGSTPPPSSTADGDRSSSAKRGSTGKAVSPSSKGVYMSRFQAGIRQLDNEPPRSPTPSTGHSAGTSPTASGPVRRRLSNALAAGRNQQQQQQEEDALPCRQAPISLQGSLKEMMKEACAIRSSREDEIHLLTEEMRQLNERIWQLRYVIANRDSTSSGKAGAPSHSPPSPGRRLSKNAEKEAPVSQTQRLSVLQQERRVIVEKLQYVVNDPE